MASRTVLAGLLAAAALSAASGQAQTVSRVADLATAGGQVFGSDPQQLTAVGDGRIVFVAGEPGSGSEVWGSDGTAAGTLLLADLCPGECGSSPAILDVLNGAALFIATTEDPEDQIWRSDGTPGGTVPLRDGGEPLQVFRSTFPGFAAFGGFLYFEACGKAQGCGLWRTDGTPAGTRLFLSAARLGNRGIQAAAATDDALFFVASYPSDPVSFLWRTDGTAAGTVRLERLDFPQSLTPMGKKLFFTATAGGGEELWVSDGTRSGTRSVTSFHPPLPFGHGGDGGGPPALLAAGDHVDFAANDGLHGWEIWRSDGTPEGTRPVTDFAVRRPFNFATLSFAEVKGRLLIPAADARGWALWSSDGRSMVRLHDCLGGCDNPAAPVLVTQGDRVLFTAGPGYGHELWSTDGTAAGTRELLNDCTGPCLELIRLAPWQLGGLQVINVSKVEGDQLWTTDGTPAGTRRLTHLPSATTVGALPVAAGSRTFFGAEHEDGMELWVRENGRERQAANLASDAASSWPTALAAVGPRLVFQAGPPDGDRSVWQTEGTEATTSRLLDPFRLPADCDFMDCSAPMAAADGWLALVNTPVFNSDDVKELWRTDGTPAGTFRLQTVTAPDRLDEQLAAFQGTVVFFVHRSGHLEVWSSDGTPAGTVRVAELGAQNVWSAGGTGSEVYFLLGDAHSHALWRTDGTAAGTVQVAGLPLGAGLFFLPPLRAGRQVFFEISLDGKDELWMTDGTSQGTVKVLEDFGSGIEQQAIGGVLYFVAQKASSFDLWRTDGTAAGTALLRSWPEPASPTGLTAFQGRLFFAAGGPEGNELWSSDGTAAGTTLLRDINPQGGSHPSSFAVLGDELYFSAFDPEHGFELWGTDGTSGGTHRVQDIAPGRRSSAPARLTVAGDRLYFTADDGATGRELWTLSNRP
jgi:ELWxxDGT repeat protein